LDIEGGTHYTQVFLGKNRSYKCDSKRFELSECLMYKFPTRKGDCGTLITSVGQNFPNKIMGMHVAGGISGRDYFGLAIPVFREDVEAALRCSEEMAVGNDINFDAEGPELFSGPNLRSISTIPMNEQIHVTRKSKITKSCISEFLDIKPKKHLPIMSPLDSRAGGVDPLVTMVNDSLSVEHVQVDSDDVASVEESLREDLRRNLKWPIGKRRLTIKEALGGIPGILASLKVKTSAGYPLCKLAKKKGKTDFFFFDSAVELHIEPFFEKLVEDYLLELETQGIDERRFVAFLKDELISSSKVKEKRCRIIYCGDLISNVAYRVIFGHILAAFNNSYFETSSAIGLNQYSWDMQVIYDYLTTVGKNFVAGDFKNFDKRIHPQFQDAAYRILMSLCDNQVTTNVAKNSFIIQQCFSSAQVLNVLIKFGTTHFSGCFFTTIVNNLINELYIRYCFSKLCPELIFSEHVRLKVLGDDHIYCFSDEAAERCRPWDIREQMEKLGQTYTSDRKNEELGNEFRAFEDITFLGAHPIEMFGQFTGALKKETLEETLHWTRNKNLTIFQEAKTAIELASAWGKDYYYSYYTKINRALSSAMFETVPFVGWKEMAKIVCSRTAASGLQHPYGFVAQGPPVNSLAKLNADKSVIATKIGVSDPSGLSKKAVNEEAMGLLYGTESNVYRTNFVWNSNQAPESGAIASFDVPFGILGLGDPQNLQNMPFDRFAYWKGDVELCFQLNATPFQQGLAAAYFMPLASYESELANVTTNEFVFVQPDQNATYTLPIPFKYLRSVMNTIARDTESLGTVYFVPISSLKGIAVDEVTVTVYSAFPNSNFSIPRPVELVTRRPQFYNTLGAIDTFDDSKVEYFAQGNSASTVNNYNISNAGGDMPVQITGTNETSATQDIDASAEVKIPMPLDNPPLCSGAIPIEQAFPGMATSHGVRPTRDMQLKPTAFSRQQMEIFNPAETKVETLLSKMCLLTKFTVTPSQPVGTELYHITLNTRLGLAEGPGIPVNLAVLNQFMFWKADFEFTFVAVQTQYHSMRLRAVTQYAAPSVMPGAQNTTYASLMNFASNSEGTNYVHRELVKYNAQTEFLRTYQGEDVVDPIQNYSLGSFSVDIANALIAPDTVEPSVEVCVFLRILNPKVAVPSPASPFTWNDYLKYDPIPSWVMRGRQFFRSTLFNLESVSTTISRVPLSEVDWLGDEPPNGNYEFANLAEVGFVMIFQNSTGTQTMRFTPDSVMIVKDASYVTFMTNPNEFLTFEPNTQRSSASLPNGSALLREYTPFEAQGPEVDEERQETTENIDEMPSTSVTKEEAPSRPNQVCKLEIGEKFEFCISDIHEIGRRYIRMVPINNPALDQFAVYSGNSGDGLGYNLNIPTQPQSHWRALFAAWAGGIKFRLFRNRDAQGRPRDFPQVFFVPFYNRDVLTPSVPIIDAMSGIGFEYGSVSVNSGTAITGPIAREVSYPISNATYIDVSVPFQSHYNFCYNSQTQSIAPISSGTLTLSSSSTDSPLIFTAFADDLRLGIYRSPRLSSFDMTVFTQGVGGFFNPLPGRPTLRKAPSFDGELVNDMLNSQSPHLSVKTGGGDSECSTVSE